MNKYIIGNIGYFLELWMILLYVETIWKQKICFTAFGIVLFVYNGIVLTCANLNLIPDFCLLTTYILLFGYLSVKYKGKWKELFVKICISLVLAWATEIVAGVIVVFVGRNIKAEVLRFILVNVISVLVALLVTQIVKKGKKFNRQEIKFDGLLKTIFLCFIPVCITLVDYYYFYHKTKLWYDVALVVFFVVLFWYLQKLQKTEYEMKQKELALGMNRVYSEVYEEVINDIRKKQHDFQNQLTAIYGSHKVAQSMDELVRLQRTYCDTIQEDREYENILLLCNEPVLAGFLYYKCLSCKEKKVTVQYEISINEYACKILTYEMIEILGILLDNAMEQELINGFSQKQIEFSFIEKESEIRILVSNRIADWSEVKLDKIFQIGYSTKGTNRGLGLPRVKEICDKYGLEIEVLVEQNKGEKITFSIVVPE